MVTQCNCPFCDGDLDGCCFCEHTGRISVGEGYVFKNKEELKPFQKASPLESDLRRLFEAGGFDHLHTHHKNKITKP
jgi:hypothetical protein